LQNPSQSNECSTTNIAFLPANGMEQKFHFTMNAGRSWLFGRAISCHSPLREEGDAAF